MDMGITSIMTVMKVGMNTDTMIHKNTKSSTNTFRLICTGSFYRKYRKFWKKLKKPNIK